MDVASGLIAETPPLGMSLPTTAGTTIGAATGEGGTGMTIGVVDVAIDGTATMLLVSSDVLS